MFSARTWRPFSIRFDVSLRARWTPGKVLLASCRPETAGRNAPSTTFAGASPIISRAYASQCRFKRYDFHDRSVLAPFRRKPFRRMRLQEFKRNTVGRRLRPVRDANGSANSQIRFVGRRCNLAQTGDQRVSQMRHRSDGRSWIIAYNLDALSESICSQVTTQVIDS